MSYRTTFELASYLVFLSGLISVWLAGGIGTLGLLASLPLVALSWWLGPLALPKYLQLAVAVLLTVLFVLDGFIIHGGFATASLDLLIMLGLYKLFVRAGGSDYLILYLIAFSLILVSSIYTISISYLIILVVFVFLSIFTFILLESRPAYEDRPAAPFPIGPYLNVTLVITSLTVLLSIPIFLAIPRGALGFLTDDSSRMAGFSRSVDLGEMGQILENSEVVMRVAVNRPVEELPLDLKWRGIALDRFDGHTWISTQNTQTELFPDQEGRLLVPLERRQREDVLEQNFLVEPFSEVIFSAGNPIQFSGFRSRWSRLRMDGNDSFQLWPRPNESLRYFVHSDLRPRSRQVRQAYERQAASTQVSPIYLDLPPLDPRIAALAEEITLDSPAPIQKALYLERYLKDQFTYSLRNPSGGSADPLADFLLARREGHCEYFATAHAVMLRTLGIPSRVVNGFRRGEFNEWSHYFIVRQSDAHSWVEAYFPSVGWIEFDPTPSRPDQPGFALNRWANWLMDSVDVLWTELVTFDRFKQVGFFQGVRRELKAGLDNLGAVFQRFRDTFSAAVVSPAGSEKLLPLGLLFLLLTIASVFGYRLRHRLRSALRNHFPGTTPGDTARAYYAEFAHLLKRQGLKRQPGETPGEFGRRAATHLGSTLPEEFTQTYYGVRFGTPEAPEDSLRKAREYLQQLKKR
jgi:protein-glutamine gamma-glutamyltransferase